jgi:hypothetical protein
MTELKITLEEFKLIKSFYPAFTRKNRSKTNDFIIDWNSLMPVVDVVESLGYYLQMSKNTTNDRVYVSFMTKQCENVAYAHPGETRIESLYKAVVCFIKWQINLRNDIGSF